MSKLAHAGALLLGVKLHAQVRQVGQLVSDMEAVERVLARFGQTVRRSYVTDGRQRLRDL